MERTLFLAAFPPEIDGLDASFERATVGVGLVEAAIGASAILAERKPAHVVMLGTVGAYPNAGLAIGDVVVAKRVILVAASGAIVDAMPSSAPAVALDDVARKVVVATTLSITTENDLAAAIEKRTRAEVEHLEAFAVARACVRAGVPFSAVFGVANVVGSHGRDQWRENHERAAAAAIDAVRNRPRPPTPA